MLTIIPIPAFNDNYIWLLHNGQNAVVVDPGDATPVIATLKQFKLKLSAILITHHHSDHIDGVAPLLAHLTSTNALTNHAAQVYAPSYEQFNFQHTPLSEGDSINLPSITQHFKVMWLPGHTLGHIAYVNDDYLFCGDTLFGAGCGRLFEGTPAQMLHSLQRLKNLAPAIHVFCTHEYTARNIDFALTLEPSNDDLIQRKHDVKKNRAQQIPSLPSTIELELKTNPFLRCNQASIFEHSAAENNSELSVFTTIRTSRNYF